MLKKNLKQMLKETMALIQLTIINKERQGCKTYQVYLSVSVDFKRKTSFTISPENKTF